jgi:amidohydrolase
MDIDKLKSKAAAEIDARRRELEDLSLRIHSNPELGFKEVKAADWLTGYLEGNGFEVERGICQLETAFRGSYGTAEPKVALLAEYDALPNVGHACGHNIICTAAVGAAVALKGAIDEVGGTIVVIGTPGEEVYGGKVIMAQRGAFSDIDAVMIVHPSVSDIANTQALACAGLEVQFKGKASHAAAFPEEGVNALEAMIQSFNNINSLRQHIDERARIHGIITDGGEAPNIVPSYTAGSFLVRAADEAYLEQLKRKVLNCFKAASVATGARLKYRWTTYYAPLKTNPALIKMFATNMATLGRQLGSARGTALGSSDVGNVSALVPTIHPMIAIAPQEISVHSPEFASAAVSEEGMHGLLDGAKAMAMTAIDLIAQPTSMADVKRDFFATA